VEAADGAACDGDEEEREEDGCGLRVEIEGGGDELKRGADDVAGRRFDGAAAEDRRGSESDDEQGHGGDELQRVDVVAGLEECPDGQHGSDVGVHEKDDDPGEEGQFGECGVERVERAPVTHDDGRVHDGEGDDRGQQQADPAPMEEDADDEGDRDLHDAGRDRGRVHSEHGADDDPEDGQHDRKGHEEDEQEEEPNALVDE
jgi:hypothetical protein